MSAIIQVENLSFGYTQDTILKGLSFEVTKGQFLTVAGPNGAGKTTLLNLLVKKLAQKVAVVRQEFVPVFDFTVAEMVSMARTPYLGTFGFESKADRKIVNEALEMTDTICFAARPLAHLSGGERQRVFIARALAQNTAILLLDEPTSFLDLKHQVDIYDLLKAAQLEKGKTIVAITHDIILGADSDYQYGRARDVFSPEQIEKVFGVRTFSGKIGQEKFFIPLGKFAKDSTQINSNPDGTR